SAHSQTSCAIWAPTRPGRSSFCLPSSQGSNEVAGTLTSDLTLVPVSAKRLLRINCGPPADQAAKLSGTPRFIERDRRRRHANVLYQNVVASCEGDEGR